MMRRLIQVVLTTVTSAGSTGTHESDYADQRSGIDDFMKHRKGILMQQK